MPDEDVEPDEDVDVLARRALRQAIASQTAKDEQTAKAISFYRRSAVVGMCAIFAVIGLHFYDQYQSDSRASTTDRLVECDSRGTNQLSKDLQTAVSATHSIPRSAIVIPPECTVSP